MTTTHQPAVPTLKPEDYARLGRLLKEWTGINLQAKEHLMTGRLSPRMRALKLPSYGAYYEMLSAAGASSDEGQRFINSLTTNKTSFFREPHHFDFLVEDVFSEAKRRAASGGPQRLRLYSAGCSRGAEPYTMALLAQTHLPPAHGWDVKILATDLDTEVLTEAKRGVYEKEELVDVPAQLRRWFSREDGEMVRVHPEVAKLVTFARANLIARPFPVRGVFDVIFCRNVMIYFDRAGQDQLVSELLRLLSPGGVIAIGHSEALMRPDLKRDRVPGAYRFQPGDEHPSNVVAAPPSLRPAAAPRVPNRQARAPRPGPKNVSRPKAAMSVRRVQGEQLPSKSIVLGQWHVGTQATYVSTLLGSCVAACIFDPVAHLGGMNHFMLPQVSSPDDDSARFGVHAMEVLINALMRAGARRDRLQAKAFGAAAVNRALTSTVPAQNEAFVQRFLKDEGIPLVAARLGGSSPREVTMRTDTGAVQVRVVGGGASVDSLKRHEAELYQASKPKAQPVFNPDDVLF